MDGIELSTERDARVQLFAKIFPELSACEREDLASIPPGQFQKYTRTIFYGERSMLRNHFPSSMKALEVLWQELQGREFSEYEVTRSLHHYSPWRSYRTLDFCTNFTHWVRDELLKERPDVHSVVELVEYELARLRLKRKQNERSASVDLFVLRQLPLEKFQERKIALSPLVEFFYTQHDVEALRQELLKKNDMPSFAQQKVSSESAERYCVLSRSETHELILHHISRECFYGLQTLQSAESLDIGEFLENMLESRAEALDGQILAECLSQLFALLEARIVFTTPIAVENVLTTKP